MTTHKKGERGAILIFLLITITLVGLMAGMAGTSWSTVIQRSKEQLLLWRGGQIRRAIGSYYMTGHAGMQPSLPQKMDDLLRDPRSLAVVRHLRRNYLDPMTGEPFVLIRDSGGKIQGVRSSSTKEPFKQDGFRAENMQFSQKSSYAEWQFIFRPKGGSAVITASGG